MGVSNSVFPPVQLERASLKNQAAELLRGMIVSGKLASGSKVTERDVATWLSVSRMPARDALMELERQGLIVTRPGGRYVIELSEGDIRHLYQLRASLEKLAVELAMGNASRANQDALESKLEKMRRAIEDGDAAAYSASDLEIHEVIWQQAGNPYLLGMLSSMIGPIFMFISSQARMVEDWQESLRLHEQLAETMGANDLAAALRSIDAHIRHSFDLAMSAFQK